MPSNSLSSVIDITLRGPDGAERQPDKAVEICFELATSEEDDACLAYWDTRLTGWKCEDKCMQRKGKFTCGDTDHFTNFAILLAGLGGDACSDDDENSVIIWLSCAFIILAISIVLLSILVIEIRVRIEANQLKNDLNVNYNNLSSV